MWCESHSNRAIVWPSEVGRELGALAMGVWQYWVKVEVKSTASQREVKGKSKGSQKEAKGR